MHIRLPSTRLFFDVEGVGLAVDGGDLRARPTLLLLHGGPGFDHTMFKPGFSRLARSAQLVYVDQRGHGRSDPCPPEERTLARWADDVRDLCDALDIHRPIVLGHSFGAFVALTFASRHAAMPAGIVVSGATERLRVDRALAAVERLGGPVALDAAARFFADPGPATHTGYVEHVMPLYSPRGVLDPAVATRGRQLPALLFEFFAGELRRMDLSAALAAVQCRVLVIAGEEDPITPPADAEDLAAALPDATLTLISGAGHSPFRDAPEPYFSAVEAFVASVTSCRPA